MNKTKQFWSLFKFQAMLNPFIVFMPLMFAMPLGITYFMGSTHGYHPSLELLLSNQNLFFVGFIGVMLLAPEIFQGMNSVYFNGTEFLLTRAIDRPLLYRARISFFYLLVLAVPIVVFITSLRTPELQVSEYRKITHQQILAQIPGSISAPADKHGRSDEITIPNGNILVAGWHLWMFLLAAVGTHALINLIYPLKYRRFIFWAVYLGVIFTPLLGLRNLSSQNELLAPTERAFLFFATHQLLLWSFAAASVLISQLWCERRFTGMEQ